MRTCASSFAGTLSEQSKSNEPRTERRKIHGWVSHYFAVIRKSSRFFENLMPKRSNQAASELRIDGA